MSLEGVGDWLLWACQRIAANRHQKTITALIDVARERRALSPDVLDSWTATVAELTAREATARFAGLADLEPCVISALDDATVAEGYRLRDERQEAASLDAERRHAKERLARIARHLQSARWYRSASPAQLARCERRLAVLVAECKGKSADVGTSVWWRERNRKLDALHRTIEDKVNQHQAAQRVAVAA